MTRARADDGATVIDAPDVMLIGGIGTRQFHLVHEAMLQPNLDMPLEVDVHLIESSFVYKEDRDETTAELLSGSGMPRPVRDVSRADFMSTLHSLERLLVRVSYFTQTIETVLGDVDMGTASDERPDMQHFE